MMTLGPQGRLLVWLDLESLSHLCRRLILKGARFLVGAVPWPFRGISLSARDRLYRASFFRVCFLLRRAVRFVGDVLLR